jgi:hypothetical protein
MAPPTKVAENVWTTEAQRDYLQLIQEGSGFVYSWIDFQGFLRGNFSVGGGGTATVASISLPGQTGSISPTVLYNVSNTPGIYRVTIDMICTTTGLPGAVSCTVNWNNGTTLASLTTDNPLNLGLQGELAAQMGTFYSAATQNISFSTTQTGGAGSAYSIYLILEYLGN